MPGKVQLSIPTPCHENWEAMSPTDKGRFCASCQKNVVDFTKASDRQIAVAIRESDTLCGRFSLSQLERDLVIPKEKNKLWVAASAAVVTLLTVGNHTLSAQTVAVTEQTDNKTDDLKLSLPELRSIKGTVVDEYELPVPGVTVTDKISKKSTQTDFDGVFSLVAKTGDTLVFEQLILKTHETVVTDSNKYKIIMYDNSGYDFSNSYFGGLTVKRTFFGRIFHSIDNIFR
ncbi:hypothetical protein FMM05_11730 [Flavobacterium zepuense]|uniref:CarboxypepD_reg-like domain-containing protein n=1 Tax=Flavobacterium zepuense TaxID=2593302 RepID=A0A552V025_9FLAO|nr:carboxypeptidase-like regulatory domain-containing protein [Flavobacterium zepuense]TRW23826.1 hypothetical protein FMM05_11730 [Flavobacterium zepuense]